MASLNYNVAGAVTGILGLILPFILFIRFRPRRMLQALEESLLYLEKVLGDGRSNGISDDCFHFPRWDRVQQEYEEWHKKHARILRSEVNRLTSCFSEVEAIARGLTYQLYVRRRKVLSTLAEVSAAELRERQRQLQHEVDSQASNLTSIVVAAQTSSIDTAGVSVPCNQPETGVELHTLRHRHVGSHTDVEDPVSVTEVSSRVTGKDMVVSHDAGKRVVGRVMVNDKPHPKKAIRGSAPPELQWAPLRATFNNVEYVVDLGYNAEAVKEAAEAAAGIAHAEMTKFLEGVMR
ncbi:uncharacterized protein C8Q71DRAFT_887353 [Rhodofomes roseus]|uniref:Uncharacterized protein n=1 Tax=Rhodofomes roseus TaxID=34475 RepID=A0ABQ8K031_9APHY|nr:uncharacterized protein C8Q71DRAFT_887353 [Rhodofomes roseus]KAH9829956.1 hypothetical protein C8Q71DRAFT_887353 [Rhodofomes roseus]